MKLAGVAHMLSCCALALIGAGVADAQLPLPPSLPNARLAWVFPPGGQKGTSIDVTVRGDDLDGANQLYFDDPGITAALKPAAAASEQNASPPPIAFTVTISPNVKPGVYDVRVAGKYGVSNPRAFVVGNQPELAESKGNDTFAQATRVPMGAVVNGCCDGAARDYFVFSAKQGERVLVDCQAFRIDSRLDGTLVLYDSTGRELDRDRNTNRRDPLIDFTAPHDGDYVVVLYDHVFGYYTVQGECFYRLSISNRPHLDFVFPPAGLPGSQATYTVYGRNLPGGQPAPGVFIGGKPLEKLTVNIPLPAGRAHDIGPGLFVEPSEAFIDGIGYRLESLQGPSNPVLLSMAGAPVVVEQEPNDTPGQMTLVKPPCEYVGQFYPRGDRDWIYFEAQKGDVYWIEVFSQRLGLPTDPFLLVQQVKIDEQGREQVIDLHSSDDLIGNSADVHWSFLAGILYSTATHDTSYRFQAPSDGRYRVMVRDLARASHDDARRVYRLSIRPPQEDFRLVAVPRPPTNTPLEGSQRTVWSPLVRKGGAELIDVYAYRRDGFEGEIRVTAENLPPGVTSAPIVIAPGQIASTLVLHAADTAPPGMAMISIVGRAKLGLVEASRAARPATMIWADQLTGVTYSRTRLTNRLAVAVSSEEMAPFSLQVDPNLGLETSRLGTVKFSVNVVRRGDFKGNLILTAYGLPPIPGNPMHAQPKYHATTENKADQTGAELSLTVPNPAPTGTYTFFVSGTGTVPYSRNTEPIKANPSQTVGANTNATTSGTAAKADIQTSSPSNTLTLKITPAPLAIDLPTAGAKIKAGDKLDLPLTIKRLYQFTGPVQIYVRPPEQITGIAVSAQTIPADQSQAVLKVDVANTVPTGSYPLTVQAVVLMSGQYLSAIEQVPLTIESPTPTK